MAVWSLCLNPNWGNRTRGLFVPNPVAGHTNRFWHNDETEETRSPSRPPAPRRVGISVPAVPDQVVVAIREDARYTIENIMVDCSARGSGAGQASPFRNAAGDLVCTFSRPPDATGVLLPEGTYSQIGPERVFQDPVFPTGISRYELTIIATLRDVATGELFEFSYDPEMDVEN